MFGKIVDGAMQLNDAGIIVDQCWLNIPNHFPQVDLDAFIVMPNHVHGIIVIAEGPVGAKVFSPLRKTNNTRHRPSGAPAKSVGSIVRGFKIGVTEWFRKNTDTNSVWQRSYYDHVIRNQGSLNNIRQYIFDNPSRWAFDRENPAATRPQSDDAWSSQHRRA